MYVFFGLIGLVFIVVMLEQIRLPIFQWIGKGTIQIAIGALLLVIVNLVGGSLDLHIPLNLMTIAIAGVLGIPGIISLACISLFII